MSQGMKSRKWLNRNLMGPKQCSCSRDWKNCNGLNGVTKICGRSNNSENKETVEPKFHLELWLWHTYFSDAIRHWGLLSGEWQRFVVKNGRQKDTFYNEIGLGVSTYQPFSVQFSSKSSVLYMRSLTPKTQYSRCVCIYMLKNWDLITFTSSLYFWNLTDIMHDLRCELDETSFDLIQ